jgi:hypothetical protein
VGSVRVPTLSRGKPKTLKLKSVATLIPVGAHVTAKLKLSARSRASIRRALRARKPVTATIRVVLADRAHNTRTLTRQIKLKL